MLKRNKLLIFAAVAALLFLIGYSVFVDGTYFATGESAYPKISDKEAAQIVSDQIKAEQDFDIPPSDMTTELYVNAEAERFLEQNELLEEYAKSEYAPPVSMWKVTYQDWDTDLQTAYFVDLMTGDIIGFLDSTYYNEAFQEEEVEGGLDIAKKWLQEQGIAGDFKHTKDETNDDGVVMHHFVSKEPAAGDTPLLLKVYTLDGWFVGFFPKLDVPESYVISPVIEGLSGSLSMVFYFGYMGLIFIIALIYWAMRGTDKSLTVTVPLLTGIVLLAVGILMITNIFGIIEGVISGFLVFMAMMAVYSKQDRLGNRSPERINYLREKVLQGYLLGVITFLPSFFFYMIAEKVFGAWGSSEDAFLMLKDALWVMLTPFLVGFYAAVSEEMMYRKFGEFVFKRVWNNQIFIALVTSFIWATAHLGYTVHPWYLRVVELTFFVGPFFYWVYKKYGVTVSMISHYLFNCFLVSLTLMSFDADRYVYSLLFLLVPLLICFIPAKRLTSSPSVENQAV